MKKLLTVAILLVTCLSIAQKENTTWDVNKPGESFNYTTHKFTTTQGTWMNLDVSPDGKTIVFDMLGDIYTMPIQGGNAKAIRTGIAFEVQPRFSPDGKYISFTSDAGGGDNIWIMNTQGKEAKQITKESFRLLNNAVWTPDSKYLIARKHFTSSRSLGAGELWQYHITGGSGIQVVKKKNDQQDINEPWVSSDAKHLYYSEDMYSGGFFQYNKDPNKQIYAIKRYNLVSGERQTITGGPGGAARPTVSPDGAMLAFVRRVGEKTVLYIHDLETGQEYPIYDGLNKDQQEAWAIFGVYPNFDWLPNNKELIIWSGGSFQRINTETLAVTPINFQADVSIDLAQTVKTNTPIERDQFTPKVIRNARTSPDGKTLVFSALGHLYKKTLPKGTPERLTASTDFEFEPSFSPSGNEIIYVTWNDLEKGTISYVDINEGEPVKLTTEKAIYRTPSYSKDAKQIVYRKQAGNTDQGITFTKNPGIYVMDQDGQNPTKITNYGENPMFNNDGSRIYLQTGGTYFGSLTKKLISVNLQGHDEREHVISKYANHIVPSPDNKWVAFTNLHKAYIAPMPQIGKPLTLDGKSNNVPVQQIAKDAGVNLHWSSNSNTIMWTLGDEYYSNTLQDKFSFVPSGKQTPTNMPDSGLKVGLNALVDKPSGRIAFRDARIITMNGNQVIENGVIVVNGDHIEAIGSAAEVTIPDDCKIIVATGKTIMPGLVDSHAHIGGFRAGLPVQNNWQFAANLAYGVTTAHDPSANTETVFTLSELQKAGELVGPRLYSTGFILYGADGDFKAVINNLEDARSSIARTKAFGAKSVKSYNQPRREQRQQVLQAAREQNINVVPEGGSTFFHNLTMVIDGHTGVEHNIPVAPVYKDVLEIWGASGTGYTPTLIVNYGGLNGELYYYQRDNVWEDEKLLKFTPRSVIDSRSKHRTMAPIKEYENGHILVAKTAKDLVAAGVKLNMGAHGQLQGLGAHWETWMLASGGLSNHEALKAATINGANYIGAGQDIGSLEVGKLADLIVLDKNPLEFIENTKTIEHVMINGRLYDTNTLNEVGNNPKPRAPFYWEIPGYNKAFPWHQETQSFMRGGCGCHIGHN
jgi:imidazolonepropionase-like amidohydrolase/Tol biopolymer transport system component|tara:strand:+ start:88 stop:3366 length:3279 start_codon:yes stop_codon:yes gene_type:complete